MRRLLASLLLVLISLSLVSPVLASAKSDVPACCLRNGKHHCEMGAEISTHGKPGLRAHCPFQTQGSLFAANNQKLLAASASALRLAALPVTTLERSTELPPDMRQTATHGTRGPPSRPA